MTGKELAAFRDSAEPIDWVGNAFLVILFLLCVLGAWQSVQQYKSQQLLKEMAETMILQSELQQQQQQTRPCKGVSADARTYEAKR